MSGWRRAFLLLADIGVGRPTHAPHCSRVSILLVGPTVIGTCRSYASVVRPQWPHIFIQRTEQTRPATPERFGGARKRSGGRVVGLGERVGASEFGRRTYERHTCRRRTCNTKVGNRRSCGRHHRGHSLCH